MVKDRDTSAEAPETTGGRKWPDIAAAILSYAGLTVASTVWWADRRDIDLPCTNGGGCAEVANSSYAHIHLGAVDIPVAALGIAGYLLLFTISILRFAVGSSTAKSRLTQVAAAASSIGALYSWYLQYIAHFKIGAFCVWCFTSACIMTALAAVYVRLATMPSTPTQTSVDAAETGKRAREAAGRRRRVLIASWALPVLVTPLFALALAGHRPAVAPPPAIGQPVSASTASSDSNGSAPVPIDVDFNTWVRILQHTDSQIRGPMQAPYTLVEIGDFQCPTCAKARPLLESTVDHARINMFFINDPLTMHNWGKSGSEAAFAAASQGKFWPMYDALYAHQAEFDAALPIVGKPHPVDLTRAQYMELAASAGVDRDRFAADMASHKFLPKVENSINFCNSIKVAATPTLIIRNNMTGQAFVAVGVKEIQTAVETTDWHAYDNVDLSSYGQPPSKPSKKHAKQSS